MIDYKEMYVKLFQSQTHAINVLQEAQRETEEMYMEANPTGTVLSLIKTSESDKNEGDADG